jgi:predicted DsbA family dithiol-disulfide isomerase
VSVIEVWSDIACPWASLALHRLRTARDRLGLNEVVALDLRAFPLELINRRPTPKRALDAEVGEIARHEPALGWQAWSRPDWDWPGSVLIALEAVQAAKAQGAAAADALDAALRKAFFAHSRPIGLLTEVIDVAAELDVIDHDALSDRLNRGAGRAPVIQGWRSYEGRGVKGSPHLFLPDGTSAHNPGVEFGQDDAGRPVITSADPAVFERLLQRVA